MKKKEKLRRLTAAAAAALTLFFSLSVYAQAEDEKSPPLNEMEAAETVLPAPERVGEVESLRKKNSRTYEMSDGSYECVIYAEDVNYEDESGKLVGIDNSLIADTEYAYKNKANSWNAYFPESLTDEKGLCVKRGDYSLSFSIFSDSAIETVKEADVFKAKLSEDISEAKITEDTYYEELSKDNRSLVYENEAVDFAYTVKTGYLKEDIILKRRIPGFEVNFLLKLKGIAAEQEESAVIFRNEAGEEVFKMLPMYMEDAAGNYSEDVHYSLKEHEDGYILTVTPDEAFLENAEYPVKIDPTVTVTGASSTSDTCVDEQYPASNYYSRENLWTGGALGTNAMRTYIRFSMPAGVNSTDINSATLRIKKREHSDPTAAIYPVDYDWDSRVITWNNKPSYNGNINLGTLTKDSGAWFKADLTTCTKNFISGAWTNYGIVLKEPSETNSAYKTKYYSSDAASPNKPELVINYKSSGGSSGGDTGGGTTPPTTKGNAILIGVAATGHDHSTCFTEMITNLKACNLNNAIKYYGSFSVKSINSYLSSDSTAVFFSRSHAQDVRNSNGVLVGSELLLNDDSSNYIYYKSTQISSLKLSNLKLAVFVGCMTGIGGAGVNNLPSAAVKSGAKAAVGFRSSINCEKANKWSKEFTRYMKYGYTVGEACRVLSKDTEYIGSGLESCMFCGAESVTLK